MPNTPPTPWAGRDDGDGPEHARWHKVVTSTTTHDGEPPAFASGGDQDAATGDDQPHVGLVGFRTDEGVRLVIPGDRTSTRLNSSHVASPYAAFRPKKRHP